MGPQVPRGCVSVCVPHRMRSTRGATSGLRDASHRNRGVGRAGPRGRLGRIRGSTRSLENEEQPAAPREAQRPLEHGFQLLQWHGAERRCGMEPDVRLRKTMLRPQLGRVGSGPELGHRIFRMVAGAGVPDDRRDGRSLSRLSAFSASRRFALRERECRTAFCGRESLAASRAHAVPDDGSALAPEAYDRALKIKDAVGCCTGIRCTASPPRSDRPSRLASSRPGCSGSLPNCRTTPSR